MADVTIEHEESSEVRHINRVITRAKGCSTKRCRPIRVQLNNLDFSFYPDIIECFRPRPLFFSIAEDFHIPASCRNKIARNILNNGHRRRSTQQMNKIADDEARFIGDGDTKPTHSDVKTMLIGDGYIKTFHGDVTTRMIGDIKTLHGDVQTRVIGEIIHGDVTTKVIGGHSAIDFILSIKSSTIRFFLRNLNSESLINGTISVSTAHNGIIDIDIGRAKKADEIMPGSLIKMTFGGNISENKSARTASSYTDAVKYSTATTPRTLTEYQHLKTGVSLKDGVWPVTTGDSLKDGVCLVPVGEILKEERSHETNVSKKRQNFLTKLWKKITNKSNKKKESQKGEPAVKTSKKSSKLSRFICFCRPKTAE